MPYRSQLLCPSCPILSCPRDHNLRSQAYVTKEILNRAQNRNRADTRNVREDIHENCVLLGCLFNIGPLVFLSELLPAISLYQVSGELIVELPENPP